MNTLEYKLSYRRHLPHIQPPGTTLFLTFRLAGTIPAAVRQQLMAEIETAEKILTQIDDSQEYARQAYRLSRIAFGKWDKVLDQAAHGPVWLKQPEIAQLVVESLQYRDNSVYDLDTYTVMSNHVHALFTPLVLVKEETEAETEPTYHALSAIMQSLKGFTAWKANELLGRTGQFWQHESYDHVVRNEQELQRIRRYILQNPVQAGLVAHWDEWPWSYCKAIM
jgi:putative transposase